MHTIDRLVAANACVVLSPRLFPFLVAVYLIAVYALRVAVFPGASDDDAEALFYAQVFAFGYKPTQPPLYNWLVLLAETLFGAGIAAVEAVKFACLLLLYLFIFGAGRLVFDDGRRAALASLSMVGFFYVGWESVMNYSHTVLLAAAIAATIFTLLRLEHRSGLADFAAFGAALGAGLLAKYNYALFLGPFAVAALFDPVLRRRILSRRMLLGVGIALAMAAPHFVWLAGHFQGVRNTGAWAPLGDPSSVVGGLVSAAMAALSFLSPWLVLAAVFLPRAFLPWPLPARGGGPDSDAEARRRRRLFAVTFAGIAIVIAVLVIAFSVTKVRTNWMMVLIPFALWVLLRAEAAGVDHRRYERLAGALTVGALVILVAIGIRAVTGPQICRKCNFFVPYAALAEELRAGGFTGGVIVAADHPNQLAGNLRRFFPDSRFYSTRYPGFEVPREKAAGETCIAIWNTARDGGEREALDLARSALMAAPVAGAAAGSVAAPIAFSGGREVRLGYRLLDCP